MLVIVSFGNILTIGDERKERLNVLSMQSIRLISFEFEIGPSIMLLRVMDESVSRTWPAFELMYQQLLLRHSIFVSSHYHSLNCPSV